MCPHCTSVHFLLLNPPHSDCCCCCCCFLRAIFCKVFLSLVRDTVEEVAFDVASATLQKESDRMDARRWASDTTWILEHTNRFTLGGGSNCWWLQEFLRKKGVLVKECSYSTQRVLLRVVALGKWWSWILTALELCTRTRAYIEGTITSFWVVGGTCPVVFPVGTSFFFSSFKSSSLFLVIAWWWRTGSWSEITPAVSSLFSLQHPRDFMLTTILKESPVLLLYICQVPGNRNVFFFQASFYGGP